MKDIEGKIMVEVESLLQEGKEIEKTLIQIKIKLARLSKQYGLSMNLDDWRLT